MRSTVYYCCFIVSVFCTPFFLDAEEPRTWRSGLFSVEASLEQIDGDSVRLKRTDNGTVITLPIARLSAEDQKYVANLAAQNPFEGGASSSDAQQPILRGPNFSHLEVRTVDISRTREAGGTLPNAWSCEPDSAPMFERPENVARLAFRFHDIPANVMPRRTDFFVDTTGSNTIIAFHVDVDPTRRDTSKNFTRIFIGNAVSGETIFHDLPLKLQPHGFSTDGKRFAFHQEDWGFSPTGKRTLLYIAELMPSSFGGVAAFEPFAQLKRSDNRLLNSDADIFDAAWVDDKHLLVQSENGTLILLNIDTGNAIWRTQIERRGDISLSPGGKYCFLPIGNRAVLWETLTGKAVGSVDDARFQKFRFSPNGKRFATCNEQGIMLGDTTTGTVETPFFIEGSYRGQQFFWLDDRFLFFGGSVVDTASKTAVWNYIGIRDNVKLVGGYCWSVFDRFREGVFLTAVTIPHATMILPEISEASDVALVLKPGANVSLVLDPSIAEGREEIRKSMEKKIADNGWMLADVAPITITLSMKEEEPDKIEYTTSRSIGPIPLPRPFRSPLDGKGVEVEFKSERYEIKITDGEGDKEFWSAKKTTTPPQRLPLDAVKEDSLQEVVDKAMEEQSYRKWIDEIFIPKTISHSSDGGQSRVTEDGIVDVRR